METRTQLTGGPLGRVLFSVPLLGATAVLLYPALTIELPVVLFVGMMVLQELASLPRRANPSAETMVKGVAEYFYDLEKFSKARLGVSLGVIAGVLIALRITTDNPWLLVSVVIMVYANDSLAWIVGKTAGGKLTSKLFWRYSPTKTWEGTFGGASVTVIAAALLYPVMMPLLVDTSMTSWLVTAAAASFGAILADMLGSAAKRFIGVKDSSARSELWFGHGGWLDRFFAVYGGLVAIAAAHGLLGI